MIQLDNQLFNEDDEAPKEVLEEASEETPKDEPPKAEPSYAVGTTDYTNVLNYVVFIAPSQTFTEIDWIAANVSAYFALEENSID